MAQPKEIPVYLFTGFLDSGKTTFIQETLEDPSFNDGQKTLLILTEEGEVEYEPVKFAASNVKIITVEDEEELTLEYLESLETLTNCEKVVIEYNGMWTLNQLYDNLPQNWTVYQEMTFADAKNFISYNQNMRQLVYDKLQSTESIVFHNSTREMDKMPLHKIVRAINRRCDIVYEYGPNEIELDTIEDPLPFDVNADLIVIEDKDYALWYSDMNDNEQNYYGKKIKFKGRTLIGGGLDDNEFVIGRHIMSCCVEDIQFGGLVGKWDKAQTLEHGGWAIMEATIEREFSHMYESVGPVFHVISIEKSEAPEEEVATFY